MWWLWIVGPIGVALVFLLTDWRDPRRDAEVERWRQRFGPKPEPQREAAGYRDAGKEVAPAPGPGAKRVASIPGSLARMLLAAGGGRRQTAFELVPKIAYLAIMRADATSASDHQTVVAKLDEPAPTFTARPVALLDGQREPNLGVQFKKDGEFMDTFVVDRQVDGTEGVKPGTDAEDKAIRKWLSPAVRAALLELPDAWLRVEGKTMALTLYGTTDADRLDDLIAAADVIFAEYGADGGPSLFGDLDEGEGDAKAEAKADAKPAPVAKKAEKKKPSASGKPA